MKIQDRSYNPGMGVFSFHGILVIDFSLDFEEDFLLGKTSFSLLAPNFRVTAYFKRAMQENNHSTIKQRPQSQGPKS